MWRQSMWKAYKQHVDVIIGLENKIGVNLLLILQLEIRHTLKTKTTSHTLCHMHTNTSKHTRTGTTAVSSGSISTVFEQRWSTYSITSFRPYMCTHSHASVSLSLSLSLCLSMEFGCVCVCARMNFELYCTPLCASILKLTIRCSFSDISHRYWGT